MCLTDKTFLIQRNASLTPSPHNIIMVNKVCKMVLKIFRYKIYNIQSLELILIYYHSGAN